MELKIFRDTLPQAGTSCTVKAELPLETEILISDYLPPVFKLVKCFAKPVVLQKQLQPGRLTLEGYLRCTVFYQGEDGAGLCQTEQKLPFTKQRWPVCTKLIPGLGDAAHDLSFSWRISPRTAVLRSANMAGGFCKRSFLYADCFGGSACNAPDWAAHP